MASLSDYALEYTENQARACIQFSIIRTALRANLAEDYNIWLIT